MDIIRDAHGQFSGSCNDARCSCVPETEPCVLMGQARCKAARERALVNALAPICRDVRSGLSCGVRMTMPGDERHLSENEASHFARASLKGRAASGAARLLARSMLVARGGPEGWNVMKGPSGAPTWPRGIVGSIAHDESFAVAVIGASPDISSVGIDIEPSTPLPAELASIVATRREREDAGGNLLRLKLLFCLKEAVYKATNVLDGVFLDFQDVETSPNMREAVVQGCARVQVRWITRPRICALAWI